MIERLFSYWKHTLKPWDFWRMPSPNVSKSTLKIGFCGAFPPFPNGAAAGTYYFLRAFAKYGLSQGGDVALYLLPLKNKIDKKLFSFIEQRFTTMNDPKLDVVVLWCMGDKCAEYAGKTADRTKTIAWQTMHADPALRPREQQTFDSVKQVDLVLGVTRWARECYGKQITSVDYLPFGVDSTLFTPPPPSELLKKKNAPFTCLFVSRMHYTKGIMPLLDALPLVLKKDPTIHFHFVSPIDIHSPHLGEIQPQLSEIQREYPRNIVVNTAWIPYQNIPRIYQDADLLIFPSNFEGFGLPLLEAMSTGIPSLVLDKKPMNELIIDGKTGYCLSMSKNKKRYYGYPFPDPEEISQKILFLKNNEMKRKELGRNARQHVLAHYDFSKIIPQFIKHCNSFL